MKTKKINIYTKEPPQSVSNDYPVSENALGGCVVHMINGSRGSGKSYLMSKILAQAKKEHQYDRIYLITPSALSNEAYFGKYIDPDDIIEPSKDAIDIVVGLVENDRDEWEQYIENMKIYKKLIEEISTYDEDVILGLYEEGYVDIKGRPEKPVWKYKTIRPPQSALVLDDCLSSDAMLKSNKKHTVCSIGTYNRHLAGLQEPHSGRSSCGLSLYFLVQSYSTNQGGIPRMLREQLTHLTTFKVKQPKQYDKIREEAMNVVDGDKFDEAYEHATKDKYGNLTITFVPKKPELMFRKNLNELIMFD